MSPLRQSGDRKPPLVVLLPHAVLSVWLLQHGHPPADWGLVGQARHVPGGLPICLRVCSQARVRSAFICQTQPPKTRSLLHRSLNSVQTLGVLPISQGFTWSPRQRPGEPAVVGSHASLWLLSEPEATPLPPAETKLNTPGKSYEKGQSAFCTTDVQESCLGDVLGCGLQSLGSETPASSRDEGACGEPGLGTGT